MEPDPEPEIDVRDATHRVTRQALAMERTAAGALSDATSLGEAVGRLSAEAASLRLALPDVPSPDVSADESNDVSTVAATEEKVEAAPPPSPVVPVAVSARPPRAARWSLLGSAVLGGALVALAIAAVQLIDGQLQQPLQLAQAPETPPLPTTPIAAPELPLPVQPVTEPALVPLEENAADAPAPTPSPAPASRPTAAPPATQSAVRPPAPATSAPPPATAVTRAPVPTPPPAPVPQPAPAPAPLPAPAVAAPAPAASAAAGAEPAAIAASVRNELLQADRRWFDAFYAGDTRTLTGINSAMFRLADARRGDQRPGPASFPPMRRVDNVRIDVEGEALVLLARMTEQVSDPVPNVFVSDIVELWLSTDGRWRLLGLRIRPAQ